MNIHDQFPIGALVTTAPFLGADSPWNDLKGHIEAVEPQADGTAWIYVELWIDHPAGVPKVAWFTNDELVVDCAVDHCAIVASINALHRLHRFLLGGE